MDCEVALASGFDRLVESMGHGKRPITFTMMKQSFLIVGAVILLAVCLPAAEPGLPISKETVRSAIGLFRQDPLSPRGRAAGEIVRTFADKNNDVIVNITPKVAPFVNNVKIPREDRTLLLDAFVVGNVDSQFLHNEKKDDPYAGVSEVIQVYRQMQKRNPALSLPEIENFIELEKRGELKKYVDAPWSVD